jgi:hypothetical protein
VTAESELAGFIAKFTPEMQRRIRGCRAKLEARFPDAVQMVYDNYNFLVIGFGPTRRASDAILSLAAYARGVNLSFCNVVRNYRIRRRSCAAAAR